MLWLKGENRRVYLSCRLYFFCVIGLIGAPLFRLSGYDLFCIQQKVLRVGVTVFQFVCYKCELLLFYSLFYVMRSEEICVFIKVLSDLCWLVSG